MKNLILAICMAVGLVACGGGGGSSGDATGSTAEALKAKVPVPDPTLAAQAVSVVNTTTAGDQVFRSIGALSDGGYTVAWISDNTTLFFQRYDSAGNKVGGEVAVPLVIQADDPARTAVAALRDGQVVVVRRTADVALQTAAISVSVFDASGGLVRQTEAASGANFAVVPESWLGTQVRIAPLANGGFVVLWEVRFTFPRLGTETAVFTQRYDSLGTPVGGPIQIAGDLSNGRVVGVPGISLVPDAQGGYTVSLYPGPFTWSTVHVDATGAAAQIVLAKSGSVLLLPLEGDRFVLFTKDLTGSFRQFLDSAGNPVGDPIPIAAMPFDARELVDGSFVLFWNAGGTITAQRFDSTGTPLGNLLTLGTTGEVPPLPQGGFVAGVEALADGGFAAAWSAPGTAGDLDVYTQRFIEVLTPDQAALRAKRKACLAGAKGMGGQERKAFMTACLSS